MYFSHFQEKRLNSINSFVLKAYCLISTLHLYAGKLLSQFTVDLCHRLGGRDGSGCFIRPSKRATQRWGEDDAAQAGDNHTAITTPPPAVAAAASVFAAEFTARSAWFAACAACLSVTRATFAAFWVRASLVSAAAAQRVCRTRNAFTGGSPPGFPIPAVLRMGWAADLTGTPRSFTAVLVVLPIACLEVSAWGRCCTREPPACPNRENGYNTLYDIRESENIPFNTYNTAYSNWTTWSKGSVGLDNMPLCAGSIN